MTTKGRRSSGREPSRAKFAITTFGEAQHGFANPAADSMGREEIAFDAMAARVSWSATVELLGVALG